MKPMEPKKAKTAILITVIAAVLILALCLCVLFEVPVFGKKTEPAASPTPVVLTAEPTKKPVEPARKPSEADLAGTSEMLQHPDPSNYLDSYRPMITRTQNSNVNGKVLMLLNTKPWEFEYEIVMKLDGNTQVTALAQENGYTLVLYKEGAAGWAITTDLDEYTG